MCGYVAMCVINPSPCQCVCVILWCGSECIVQAVIRKCICMASEVWCHDGVADMSVVLICLCYGRVVMFPMVSVSTPSVVSSSVQPCCVMHDVPFWLQYGDEVFCLYMCELVAGCAMWQEMYGYACQFGECAK